MLSFSHQYANFAARGQARRNHGEECREPISGAAAPDIRDWLLDFPSHDLNQELSNVLLPENVSQTRRAARGDDTPDLVDGSA
jgi:hypothetical protein